MHDFDQNLVNFYHWRKQTAAHII